MDLEVIKSFDLTGILNSFRELVSNISGVLSDSFGVQSNNMYMFILIAISFYIGKKFSKDDSFTFMLIIAGGVFYLLNYFGA